MAATCKSIHSGRHLPIDFKRITRVDSSDRCGTVRTKPENGARVVRGRRVTGLARSRRPVTHRRSAARLHAGRVATLCRKTANHCHSLPFSASYPVRPFESFISSPVAGVPASLGPGLRTVSGASRRPDGSSPSRAGLHFVERPTKNGAPSQIGGSMNARGNASRVRTTRLIHDLRSGAVGQQHAKMALWPFPEAPLPAILISNLPLSPGDLGMNRCFGGKDLRAN